MCERPPLGLQATRLAKGRYSATYLACEQGCAEVVRCLLQRRVVVDEQTLDLVREIREKQMGCRRGAERTEA